MTDGDNRMSETPALNSVEQASDQVWPSYVPVLSASNASGPATLERLGVGGMGEVYRHGDTALGRDLALKVLRMELRGNADAEERFLREARLTGSLQHPGVVPIHNLGRLADGRPCYTMKLVRGRTFADMLRDEPDGPERLPRLLAVLEKVCQAVAFAHSRGVIHRDLKPSNVMVGEFGEVQVMDWGLAKQLQAGAPATQPADEPTSKVETAAGVREQEGLSRAGAAFGTPSYMPPEQAAGDWALVDERADVFALGAILCQILTGRTPYAGADRDEALRRARRGDLAEALARLENCGADAALVALCRECLAPEREGRPRNAEAVAKRLAAYEAEVQERLRRAEVERAAAQVKAQEERKRRRLTLALAALVLLVVLGGGGGAWWQQQQRARADQAVNKGLAQAELLAAQARADPLQTDKYQQALEAARVAAQLAESASADARQRAQDLIARLEQEAEAARKDRELLVALLDVRGPREGPKYQSDARGTMMALRELTADEQFAAAFRRWGLDVDGTPPSEAVALLKARPAVVTEVIAALDEWASERRRRDVAKADVQRLSDLAALLDEQPGSKRRELRAILARGRLPVERALDVLSAALRPVPIPIEVPLGPDRARLRQLAEQTDAATEPILGLLTLVRALSMAGEEARAEQLLRTAILARPKEVVLHHTLGQLLVSQEPPRWRDAAECYAAARVARPDLGVNLATALLNSGRDRDGLDLLARLVMEMPTNPYLHSNLAYALHKKGQLDAAMAEYRQAVDLDPKYAFAHNNFGAALYEQKQWDAAMAEFRQAMALGPKDALAHNNLGAALAAKRRWDEAMAEYRQAIVLDPKFALAHNNLGHALRARERLDEAMAELRLAIALDPKLAKAHYNLGNALAAKKRWDEAMAECRLAIALDPKDASAHLSLGLALHAKGRSHEAINEFRQAIAFDPKLAKAHYNLGTALAAQEQWDEAMAELRLAIALDPKDASAHLNLGLALYNKERLDEAMAEYRQAIDIDPKLAKAHAAMGQALLQQGRYADARASTQRALDLLPPDAPLRQILLPQLQQCERLLALDKKLLAVLQGELSPANAGEAVALAWMCQQPYKKCYVASARLYTDAFASEPKVAADLNHQHRYNAARSAALAAAGQGEDARWLPDKVVCMFRRWALGWLRDDLTTYTKLAQQNNPAAKEIIQQQLTDWRSDPDLASVREPAAVDRLPDNERAAWQALWRDVDELAKRAAK
jgi:serine/threonine-protein kinase